MASYAFLEIPSYFNLVSFNRLSIRNEFGNSKKGMKVIDKISTKRFYDFLF